MTATITPLKRLDTIDAIRGCCLISMIAYHCVFDIVYIFNVSLPWFSSISAFVWQQSICWTFILLSGFSCAMSKSSFRRGVIVSICGIILTLITALAMPKNIILMGVLSFIGAAMILTAPIVKFFKKNLFYKRIIAFCCLLLSAFGFFVTRGIYYGYLGFSKIKIAFIPKEFYNSSLGFIIGLPSPSFFSTDYFPIFPWLFLFWVGFFAFHCLKEEKTSPLWSIKVPVINKLGKYSLQIYMIHQPVALAVLYIIFMLIR